MAYTYKSLEGYSTQHLKAIKEEHLAGLSKLEEKRRQLILSILQLQETIKKERE